MSTASQLRDRARGSKQNLSTYWKVTQALRHCQNWWSSWFPNPLFRPSLNGHFLVFLRFSNMPFLYEWNEPALYIFNFYVFYGRNAQQSGSDACVCICVCVCGQSAVRVTSLFCCVISQRLMVFELCAFYVIGCSFENFFPIRKNATLALTRGFGNVFLKNQNQTCGARWLTETLTF